MPPSLWTLPSATLAARPSPDDLLALGLLAVSATLIIAPALWRESGSPWSRFGSLLSILGILSMFGAACMDEDSPRAAVALGIAGSMLVFADIGLRLLVRFQGRKPDADPTQP